MSGNIIDILKANIGNKLKSPSNIGNWLDGPLIEAEEGVLGAQFTVREEFTNPMGMLHGGIYSLIIDEIMGALVFTLGNENFFSTVNLSVDYFSAAKLGEKINVRAEVVKAGKNIIHCECRITNETGKLLAKGSSNLAKTHIPVK